MGSRYRPTASLGYVLGIDLPAMRSAASCSTRARGRGEPAHGLWVVQKRVVGSPARAGPAQMPPPSARLDPASSQRLQPVVIPAQRRQIVRTRAPAGYATITVQITLGRGRRHPGTGNADAWHAPYHQPGLKPVPTGHPHSVRSISVGHSATSRRAPTDQGPYPASSSPALVCNTVTGIRVPTAVPVINPMNASALATSHGASIPAAAARNDSLHRLGLLRTQIRG